MICDSNGPISSTSVDILVRNDGEVVWSRFIQRIAADIEVQSVLKVARRIPAPPRMVIMRKIV